MAWSIFTQGGGQGAAVTWAKDLLSALGVPQSQANVQFIYDWEVSEGGGGAYNPLNQGPVPGQPQLTTTGQQYGGGAADFASWQAGITGAVDYIKMPAYSGILSALQKSDYNGARAALVASPWAASHYGGGSSFSTATPPGATPLSNIGGNVTTTGAFGIPGLPSVFDPRTWISDIASSFGGDIKDWLERLGLIILGFALVIMGIHILASGGGGSPINIQTSSEETPEGTTTTRKVNTPVSEHKRTVRTAAGTGAEDAVEAAAAALCPTRCEGTPTVLIASSTKIRAK